MPSTARRDAHPGGARGRRRDDHALSRHGACLYVDPDGTPVGVEDAFTKLEAARAHYESIGLGAGYVDQFIR